VIDERNLPDDIREDFYYRSQLRLELGALEPRRAGVVAMLGSLDRGIENTKAELKQVEQRLKAKGID
jgi:hypothetical protein